MEVHVHLLPRLLDPVSLRGGQAVVIDILRATTTIVHALAAGVTTLIACGEVDEALEIARQRAVGTTLLGGERQGQRIPGFDLDNSPLNYTPEVLGGKSLVFTTTNGTRALASCREADRILVGAFSNRQATIDSLVRDGRSVHLVCAGTDGYVTTEDVLFAGSVASVLFETCGGIELADDETQLALALWQSITKHPQTAIREVLRNSRGGRNLLDLSYDADIDRASECDRYHFAAEFIAARNEIRIALNHPTTNSVE